MTAAAPGPPPSRFRPLGTAAAGAVVFVASGAVLVLEILSLRLVAPYVGLTLQVSTSVIGCALAAITVGAWVGGRAADRFAPQRLVGPLMLAAGALVLLIGPLVSWSGEDAPAGETSAVMTTAAAAVFVPAALLSAVHPMVVKLQLGALAETGTVVGRLSGIGTAGALAGTFATGFVLVGRWPTSRILLGLGVLLILLGAALTARWLGGRAALSGAVVASLGTGAIAVAPRPCDVETVYHCAKILTDPDRPSGRTLQLDTLWHSYVDLQDPRNLKFAYVRAVAAVVDATRPESERVRALHLGGGGATIARFLQASRPGSDNLVFEIDRGIVRLDVERLGLREGDGLKVEVGDGRRGVAAQPDDSRDVVVGDAFGGVAVPWHLTTRETVADIRRVLTPGGIYVLNVIDHPPLKFARAEIATLLDVFGNVEAISTPGTLAGSDGGNLVLVASDAPLPRDRVNLGLRGSVPEYSMIDGEDLRRFVGDARVLTDDFAPVDQLITQRHS